jgi:uracil-DNA glycosylase family 4
MNRNKKERLEKLTRKMRNCKRCSLWKTRKNVSPGEGPVDAKIMIVGQAPGREEDLQGRPFVGRAGKFLNQLLKLARIKREKTFLTAPVHCFPPKNRKPTKQEIEACLPWLKKQIEIVNPKKFILLGEVAFSIFFPNKKLSDFRGKFIKKAGKEYFVSYHPAAGIRFLRMRRILERDFKRIKIN